MPMNPNKRLHVALLGIGLAVLAWSGYRPKDTFTWILEVAPAIIGAVALVALYRRFRFTDLVYILILGHAIILMVGGHYTYSEMPLFSWLRDELGWARNYYDRVGHVAQGFVPALIAREILLRNQVVNGTGWLFFLVCCIALAVSAVYEFFEWWVAVASGTAAEAFLATQGDVWDTQWDMFLALCGAVAALLLLARWHDRELAALAPPPASRPPPSQGMTWSR
jgi:putative membrane protein